MSGRVSTPSPGMIAFFETCSIPELLKLAVEMESIPEDAEHLALIRRILKQKALAAGREDQR